MDNLKVLYEDNHIIVVEKIPNIPSQGDKTGDKDMLTLIKELLLVILPEFLAMAQIKNLFKV